eukprot:m.95012 g.95012  ORF g.95012 m.95012 type:complete len:787 (+) comp14747_c2_seq1:104-2464(+)
MGELWQLAARWLNSVGVLPADDPSLQPDGRVYELAMALQDGTVLCKCANKLLPGSISSFAERPEKQFMKMQNINRFLETLVKQFRMKEGDLFTADELYYASNFAKVVETISLLSQNPVAGLAGFRRFPEKGGAVNKAEEDGQDMYQSLEELVGQSLSLKDAATSGGLVYTDDDDASEDIYGALKQAIAPESEDVYKDLLYSEEDNIYSVSGTSPDDKRSLVLAELLETEKNYVKVLGTIANVFKPTMSSQPKIISRSDINTIFSNVHELLDAHIALLADLDKVMSKSTGRIISSIFFEHMPRLRCYGPFCCQIPEAVAKLDELCTKPHAARLMDEAKRESKQRFGLKDLLNVPMQRILKYPLLLKEIVKHTPATHPDKNQLKEALSTVEELAKYINDTKKDYDNLKQIASGLRQYAGRPLQEYGSLVKDGDLMFKSTAAKEKMKLRYVFLFSNGILICKTKGSQFSHKLSIDFAETQEIVDVPHWTLPKEEQNSKHSYLWAIKYKKGGAEQQFIFAAKTMPLKRQWESAMRKNLSSIRDAKSAPPEAPARVPTLKPPKSLAGSISERPLPSTPEGKPNLPPGPAKGYMDWVPTALPTTVEAPPTPREVEVASDEAWFAGQMPRHKAEKMLETMPDGTFLVRESDGRPGEYSLSIMFQSVKHIKINRKGTKYNVAPDSDEFPSIQDLVAYFQVHSLKRHFPPLETTLRVPFRHAQVNPANRLNAGSDYIGRARSRFPYTARNGDELSFERGVELQILSTDEEDEGWWRGRLPTGQEGVFPANYVQRL